MQIKGYERVIPLQWKFGPDKSWVSSGVRRLPSFWPYETELHAGILLPEINDDGSSDVTALQGRGPSLSLAFGVGPKKN